MSAHDSQAHAAMEAAAREQAVWRRRVTGADMDKQIADKFKPSPPSPKSYLLSDLVIAILLVSVVAAVIFGVI